MTAKEIITKVKSLNLPAGSYVVFGSCPMALAGIREANDIDMLVSQKLRENLSKMSWEQIYKTPNDKPLVHDVFEAHDNWNFSEFNPTLEELLKTATVKKVLPFASLQNVRKWKAVGSRPKDLKDVQLIDEYLASK